MAVPDNPLLDASRVLSLSRIVRGVPLPARAVPEIAEYLGVSVELVREWLNASEIIVVPAQKINVPAPWAKDYTKPEMLSTLRRIPRGDIFPVLLSYGWKIPARSTKEQVLSVLAGRRKEELGKYLDVLRPRTTITTQPATTRRLSDMLTEEEYGGRLLSQFPRGKYLRKKADLALALAGEVFQTPQDGHEEGSFQGPTAIDLRTIENAEIWPARQGEGFGGDPFLNEMWFKITLRAVQSYWQIFVDYLLVYDVEGDDFEATTGWPTRESPKAGRQRSQATIDEVLKRKQEYEEWKKAKKKRQRDKRKGKR